MPDAQDQVLELLYGRWRSQTMYVGVTLGVFDVAGPEPISTARIAHQLELDEALTYRLLRALASLGLLRRHDASSFSLTDAGELLRRDHPQSMRDAVLLREGPEHTAIWKHLPAIVRDGEQNGFVREFGRPAFEYATTEPSYGKAFDAGMSSQSRLQTTWTLQALAACDLASLDHLCDVGGGQGHLLCSLLAAHPHLRGTVLDRPSVIEQGQGRWAASLKVADRCDFVAGDMFVDAPAADAYIMKMILHDWNDAESIQILSTLNRRATGPGRIFIVEHVIPDSGTPDFAALFDMHMMCWGPGRERTAQEYQALLAESGWDWVATRYPPSGAIGIVEGAQARSRQRQRR